MKSLHAFKIAPGDHEPGGAPVLRRPGRAQRGPTLWLRGSGICPFAMIGWVAWLTISTASGATLGTYTFPGPDPAGDTNTPAAANLTFTPFSRVNVSALSVSELFESANWTLAAAQDLGEYFQFTITPAAGYSLNLTTLSFDVQRSVDKRTAGEKDGPLNGQVRIYNGVSLTLADSQNFSPVGVWQNVGVNFTNVTTADGETVTIRFYGWGSAHQNGWLAFDNVTFEGAVSPVPEPSPIVLVSGGFLLFLARCVVRRR